AKAIFDKASRLRQTQRLIAKVPSIAAYAYRHSIGRPYNSPDNDLSFTGNFLNMLLKMTELKYQPNPVLARALDVLFILHADHEQNCSTTTMRTIGSSHADPYSSLAGAAAALYGPLHGGANEAVLRMLNEIGSVNRVPEFIKRVKSGDGVSGRNVSRAVRDSANGRLDRAVGGDAARFGTENRATAADLHWPRDTRLHSARAAPIVGRAGLVGRVGLVSQVGLVRRVG